eukprot:4272782-Prymnesium_polylepis.1
MCLQATARIWSTASAQGPRAAVASACQVAEVSPPRGQRGRAGACIPIGVLLDLDVAKEAIGAGTSAPRFVDGPNRDCAPGVARGGAAGDGDRRRGHCGLERRRGAEPGAARIGRRVVAQLEGRRQRGVAAVDLP